MMAPSIARPVGAAISMTLATLLFFATCAASAADKPIYEKKGAAIRGADPVAYFSLEDGGKAVYGSDEFTYDYMGTTWRFASAHNRDLFIADPEKYSPQYGGYCAFAVSHGFTKPVDPNAWHIKEGKLYLNLSKGVRKKWLKDRDGFIARANANWPSVLTACEEHGNCNQ